MNVERIKALTGRDPITARFLHKNFFTFQPVAKFWLSSNEKPVVRDDSEGFWRRVHLIPFTQSFVGHADVTLKDRLKVEAPGILAWLVRGALAWQRDGLNPPDAVRAATAEYRQENDPLAAFIEQCCVLADGASVQSSRLFAGYSEWADDCGLKPWQRLSQTAFGLQMTKRFDKGRPCGTVVYTGIGLRETYRGGL